MRKKLLVISSELISEWVLKGEIVERYYNPENLFSEITFLIHDNDRIDLSALRVLSGNAEVNVVRYKTGISLFLLTFFWRRLLLKLWATRTCKRLDGYSFNVVRCYGADLNLVLAYEFSKNRNIPAICSIHVNYDVAKSSYRNLFLTKVRHRLIEKIKVEYLIKLTEVWPVYGSILDYLNKRGISNYRIVYNVVNQRISPKNDWVTHNPLRLITIGRLIKEKSPLVFLRVVANISNVRLLVVGSGPLLSAIEEEIRVLNVSDRVELISSIPNTELCEKLAESDLCVLYSEYWEFSKVMIESSLTGVPIILNRNPNARNPEFSTLPISFVEGDAVSYQEKILEFSNDPIMYQQIGSSLQSEASKSWSPIVLEKQHAHAYLEVIQNG
jgi:glycosyltransferase involved in cell wall biosynthesis